MNKTNIEKSLQKVESKFNKAGGFFLFYNANVLKGEDFRPIVIGETEKEAEEKMNAKIEKNPEKYKDYSLVNVYISIEKDNIGKKKFHPGIGGALGISIMMYSINKFNRINNTKNDNSATFWYDDDDIENFSMSHVKKAIKIVLKGLVESNPFSTNYIKNMDSLLKKKK